MSEVKDSEEFFTILQHENFLRLVDHSIMGITLIRRGFLKYFNSKFEEIFGYKRKEILSWKKFEYFKIIHPEDIPLLLEKTKIEDKKNAILRFRGVKKDGTIIPVENYIYRIKYNDKYAYFSSYVQLEKSTNEFYQPRTIRITKDKIILLKYNPSVVKVLEDNNISYEIINRCSYREQD